MIAKIDSGLELFFHPEVVVALQRLSDPNWAVQLPLAKGKAPGKFVLERALFRPEGVHANDSPAKFSFAVEEMGLFELSMMVQLVCVGDCGNDVVFGYISHDQSLILKEAEINHLKYGERWVLVKYPIVQKDSGVVFMSNGLHGVIKEYMRMKESMRMHKKFFAG